MKIESSRSSGILMPIFSLPESDPSSRYTGDFGQSSRKFIDFLSESKQKFWQVLPLNPIDQGSHFCPYASISGFAFEPIYTDIDLLKGWNLIDKTIESEILSELPSPPRDNKAAYVDAKELKINILKKAFNQFKINPQANKISEMFEKFCDAESYWLDDFSQFYCLAEMHNTTAWQTWPDHFRIRNANALEDFSIEHQDDIDFVKFCQFAAQSSWENVKTLAKSHNITIIGDVPIYVGLNSADVWADQQSFDLDENGYPVQVSGVPPDDYFADGQVWNSPLYNWDYLKANGYVYWMKKLSKLVATYDLTRLDHFIGFERFFAIPHGEKTAVNGRWQRGPSHDFFNTVKDKWPNMPFIAEALGLTTSAVFELADSFEIPYMSIFLFGFGERLDLHNPSIVAKNNIYYTSTHDTETIFGWIHRIKSQSKNNDETAALEVQHLSELLGGVDAITSENIVKTILESSAGLTLLAYQDVIGLDNTARMNIPGTTENNWLYRFGKADVNPKISAWLSDLTRKTNRA